MREDVNSSALPQYVVHLSEHRLLSSNAGDEQFLAYAGAIAAEPYSAVLLSGGTPGNDTTNRCSVAAWNPFLTYESKGRQCRIQTVRDSALLIGDPLRLLDEIFDSCEPKFPFIRPPFAGGALGYFSYDLKNTLEHLPQTAVDDIDLPDLFFFWPSRVLIHDRLERSIFLLCFCVDEEVPAQDLDFDFTKRSTQPASMLAGELTSNFSHTAYLHAVNKVRHYIREGDVYQVNLSQRFQFPFRGDAFQLWKALFDINPAPFYAFIHAPDHKVLSTSMERFLYRNGRYMETRPIKGTRKRGATPEEDELLKLDLLQNSKDDAELSMIVDLLRNDLGRVCSPRSIRVSEHKRLETYQNVHHLVSIVTGQLEPETSCGDIIRATFPGGSITGCPKIRSMEIIDELEPNVRHVYTGAIGYLGWHRNFDLNIAIRTALIRDETCYFSVGGGIVYDSQAEDEYQETLHKGRTLFDVVAKLGKDAS